MSFTKQYNKHIKQLDSLKLKQLELSKEMQLAYEYKESLIGNMRFADNQIKDKQKQYYKLLNEIQSEISKLKIDFDLHLSELNKH